MLILNVQHFVYKQSFLLSELHNTPNRKLHCLSYNPRWIDVFALSYLHYDVAYNVKKSKEEKFAAAEIIVWIDELPDDETQEGVWMA